MNNDLGCSLNCETPGSERRAHVPTANELDAHSPPDQDDWLGCAQCCIRVTIREQGSAGHGTCPGAGRKCQIDYKPFLIATIPRLAFFTSLISFSCGA